MKKTKGYYDEATGIFIYEGLFTYLLSPPFPLEEIKLRYMKYNVLKFLYKKGNPHSISKRLNIARPTVIQHLEELEKMGLVEFEKENGRRKYASPFKISDKGKHLIEKSVGFPAKSSRVVQTKRGTSKQKYSPDDINGHAFVFTLVIPKDLKEWKRRREILEKRGISYEPLTHFFNSEGEKLIVNARKIHFTGKSIIIYESAEYISKLSKQSQSKAIYHFEVFLRIFERMLGMNLKHSLGNRQAYKYRVSRQHYALIQNSLAKQYNAEKKKLEVYNGRGQMMYLIDNSPTERLKTGENHFEAVHPKTSPEDITPAQTFFKKIVDHPLDPEEIKNNLDETSERIKKLSEQSLQLSQVLEQINSNVINLTKIVIKDKDK